MIEPVLEFDGLRKDFGETEVLKGINAKVLSGEVIGLVGLNGAGKTTLLETALGLSPPSSGTAYVFGRESTARLDNGTKARIGFVPQQDELQNEMLSNNTGAKYIKLIAEFYDNWNRDLVERLGKEWAVPLDARISTLSVGQRQKLSILSALGHEPELIVLDEPVASLDPLARRKFLQELVGIADSRDRTIIFSSHIISDLERVASRVWILRDGRIEIDEHLDVLKEHTARIHLPPGAQIPAYVNGDKLIHCRREQNTNILVFRNWDEEQHQRLEQVSGFALTPELLSLEDIFLEIHS